MRILVIGAGIGGLTCAAMLSRTSHDVVLIEREPALRADGAGILLHTRAIRTLERSGASIRHLALPLKTMSITTPDGRSRGAVRDRGSFARPELMRALARVAPTVDVRFGTVAAHLRETPDGASCVLGHATEWFDLVVGADGLSSSTRATVAPDVRVRDAGQVCWRGIVDLDSGASGTEMWNGRERVGVVPLRGGRTYVYLVAPRDGAFHLTRPATLPPREEGAVRALLALAPSHLLRHELREVDRPTWGTRRIALLGDAAHAMTPNLGLGAALAIEDAATLFAQLERGRRTGAYARRRQAPVRITQLASRALGRIAHDRARGAVAIRRLAGVEGP